MANQDYSTGMLPPTLTTDDVQAWAEKAIGTCGDSLWAALRRAVPRPVLWSLVADALQRRYGPTTVGVLRPAVDTLRAWAAGEATDEELDATRASFWGAAVADIGHVTARAMDRVLDAALAGADDVPDATADDAPADSAQAVGSGHDAPADALAPVGAAMPSTDDADDVFIVRDVPDAQTPGTAAFTAAREAWHREFLADAYTDMDTDTVWFSGTWPTAFFADALAGAVDTAADTRASMVRRGWPPDVIEDVMADTGHRRHQSRIIRALAASASYARVADGDEDVALAYLLAEVHEMSHALDPSDVRRPEWACDLGTGSRVLEDTAAWTAAITEAMEIVIADGVRVAPFYRANSGALIPGLWVGRNGGEIRRWPIELSDTAQDVMALALSPERAHGPHRLAFAPHLSGEVVGLARIGLTPLLAQTNTVVGRALGLLWRPDANPVAQALGRDTAIDGREDDIIAALTAAGWDARWQSDDTGRWLLAGADSAEDGWYHRAIMAHIDQWGNLTRLTIVEDSNIWGMHCPEEAVAGWVNHGWDLVRASAEDYSSADDDGYAPPIWATPVIGGQRVSLAMTDDGAAVMF